MPADFNWQEVLETWFGNVCENPDALSGRMPWWFGPDQARDRQLANHYGDHCEAALAGQLGGWQAAPLSRLALILLLDQFPRNLFRGTPLAFSGDDRAAMLCLSGVQAGLDRQLLPVERVFFYMPLQHAEDAVTQQVSVKLFRGLADEQSASSEYAGFAGYAKKHLDIIDRFGRFPHRNETLGRPATADEISYLEEGGERFGQ
jgi:uncharacterized protein (DUF924 family)